MWKLTAEVTLVKLLCNILCVNVTARTNRISLTGSNGTNSRSADTRFTTTLGKLFLDNINIFELNEWNLNTLSGCQMYI